MSEKNYIGKALQPAGLVTIQDGSVVSRTLIDGEAGTVSIFAFDAGQGLSEHTAPFDALVMILEGEAKISINHQDQTVLTGEWIIMPANVPHALQAVKPFKMALIMIRK